MRTILKAVLVVGGLVLVGALQSQATITIAKWTFEGSTTPADLTDTATISGINPEIGTGTASGVHASALTDWTTPLGNGSANSLSANNWAIGDYFQFKISTLGYSGINLSWDQTSSGTGPKDFILKYSTDGSLFTTYLGIGGSWVVANGSGSWNASTATSGSSYTINLSTLTGINGLANVYFRLVDNSNSSANGDTVGVAGTDRVDNFKIEATAVPEASTWFAGLGLSLGMLGSFVRKYRK